MLIFSFYLFIWFEKDHLGKISISQACPLSPGNCILTWLFQELPGSRLTHGKPTNTFSKIITLEIQLIEAMSPLVGKAIRCTTKGMYFFST